MILAGYRRERSISDRNQSRDGTVRGGVFRARWSGARNRGLETKSEMGSHLGGRVFGRRRGGRHFVATRWLLAASAGARWHMSFLDRGTAFPVACPVGAQRPPLPRRCHPGSGTPTGGGVGLSGRTFE